MLEWYSGDTATTTTTSSYFIQSPEFWEILIAIDPFAVPIRLCQVSKKFAPIVHNFFLHCEESVIREFLFTLYRRWRLWEASHRCDDDNDDEMVSELYSGDTAFYFWHAGHIPQVDVVFISRFQLFDTRIGRYCTNFLFTSNKGETQRIVTVQGSYASLLVDVRRLPLLSSTLFIRELLHKKNL
jgi:hypothetical protein